MNVRSVSKNLYLFVNLFNDTVSCSDYVASIYTMSNELESLCKEKVVT
jgi:hypothetical protein